MLLNGMSTSTQQAHSKDYTVKLAHGVTEMFDRTTLSVLQEEGVSISNGEAGVINITASSEEAALRSLFEKVSPIALQQAFAVATEVPYALKSAMESAQEYHRAAKRFISRDPAFPLGGSSDGIPYSWPFNSELESQFEGLLSKLLQHGIEMKIGVELELSLSRDPIKGYEDKIRNYAEALVKREADKWQNDGDTTSRDNIAHISTFHFRDFLAFQLYEEDPVIQEVFEYKAGTANGGNGYYDNDEMYEFTTKPLAAEDFFAKYIPAQRHLLERCHEFGFMLESKVAQQINMSFWKDGRNIMLAENPEDEKLCERVIQAFGFALEDGFDLMIPSVEAENSHKFDLVSQSRVSCSRHAYGRLELKGFIFEAHHLIVGACLGAGAALSAIDENTSHLVASDAKELEKVHVVNVKTPHGEQPWLRHAINGSELDIGTGKLSPDEGYIRLSASKIVHQIISSAVKANAVEGSVEMPSDEWCQKFITAAIEMAEIVDIDGSPDIVWPQGMIIGIGDRGGLDTDLLNEHFSLYGISKRFRYKAPTEEREWQERNASAHDNVVLKAAYGSNLLKRMLDARKADINLQSPAGLFHEFIPALANSMKDMSDENIEDDGTGYAALVVPLEPRSQGALMKTMKLLMQQMRSVDDSMGAAMRKITLSGIQINEETSLAERLVVHVPLPVFQQISLIMNMLSDRLSNKASTATSENRHESPSI